MRKAKSRLSHNKGKKLQTVIEFGLIPRRKKVYRNPSAGFSGLMALGISIGLTASLTVLPAFAKEQDFINQYISTNDIAITEDTLAREGREEEQQLAQSVLEPEPSPQEDSHDDSDIQKMIEDYFPEDPDTAQAISKAESGHNPNKEGIHRAGKYSWSTDTYKGECSIGLFQINLAEDGCQGRYIHGSKVPGETIEEKIAWLKVPENNLKIARQIKDGRGNWSAWSTYTSGTYKNHLSE